MNATKYGYLILICTLLLLLTKCVENKTPYVVIEISNQDNNCKYTLSRPNGFGVQMIFVVDTCDKYKLFQEITL